VKTKVSKNNGVKFFMGLVIYINVPTANFKIK
jgi:hypothetical protein